MENFLFIEELQKGTDPSGFFRKLLVFKKYIKFDGKKVADFHRRLYLQRHKNDSGKAGFYAKNLLW